LMDDIEIYDPSSHSGIKKIRIDGTVMDVADPSLARQRRILGTFP